MLPLHGRTVFAHAVGSFAAYFKSEPFLFIVRDVADTPAFVQAECRKLGIDRARIVALQSTTRGQAETVQLGLQQAAVRSTESVTIFNIDTFRPNFTFPRFQEARTDGYLEVFRGAGANWSYVRPTGPDSNLAAETAEKRPISDLCCTGLYNFSTAALFFAAYNDYVAAPDTTDRPAEMYVAPMYNVLIRRNCPIRYTLIGIEQVIFCGVPAEYEALLAGPELAGLPASS